MTGEEAKVLKPRIHGPTPSVFISAIVGIAIIAGAIAWALGRARPDDRPGRVVSVGIGGVTSYDLAAGREERLNDFDSDVAFGWPSPDGRWAGYQQKNGDVWLIEHNGDRHFQVAENSVALGWSPDGRLIVGEIFGDRDLVAVDPEGAREPLLAGGYLISDPPVWIDDDSFAIRRTKTSFVVVRNGRPAFDVDGRPLAASPDGKQITYQAGDEVKVATLGANDLSKPSILFEGKATVAATSPQGFLALGTKKGLYVFERGTKGERITGGEIHALAWAVNGTAIVYQRDETLYAIDIERGKPKRILEEALPSSFAVVP